MDHILNADIFDYILGGCSKSSLLNVSLVSSHLRLFAMPHLLRTVSLDRNPEQIIGFLEFIINNSHRNIDNEIIDPGRYVLAFEIPCHSTAVGIQDDDDHYHFVPAIPGPYTISAWAHLLTLRSLVIQAEIESICLHFPDFAATLLARPQLTDIDLWWIGSGSTASNLFGQVMHMKAGTIRLRKVKYYVEGGINKLALHKGEGFGSVLFCFQKIPGRG
ncbi:hypothetical protein CPB84DRAFT_1784161 [Gymnopilus junonius]|uniref:F-box domain-containing protein n=1 Tax=Gymnopilus junonius TaxID=109634 RepID=A0A9P5NKP2_GYMJU|nr:hypothetical protein CPB84DRAFT_1784161 [Gymnopilus junonius]